MAKKDAVDQAVETVDTAPLPERPAHKTGVAIFGFTAHRELAFQLPNRERWEFWGLNELHRYHKPEQFNRWFEIHPRPTLEPDKAHIQQMGKFPANVPIYMHQHWDDIPNSRPFPKVAVERALNDDYFTSSIAWEIGLALAMGFEDIHVYGVDMANDREYVKERPCCEYWLGWGRGKGVRTFVPVVSDLLKCVGQYGFEGRGTAFAQKLTERKAWLHKEDNERLALLRKLDAEYEQKHGGLLTQRNQFVGAINELGLQLKHGFLGEDGKKIVEDRLKELHGVDNEALGKLRAIDAEYDEKHTALMAERNQVLGGIQDCEFWDRQWTLSSHTRDGAGPTPDRSLDPQTGITPEQARIPEPEPIAA